ncbi:hypothetical protein, partial [Brevibacillus nitrificans]|uniref:hypothetical protein n=1 Tax=Brevibacillus nitrificans TaxID=651560 RepID=UPI00286B9D8B
RIKLSNKVCIWFKAGKSLNDRLINAFAVQFSRSIRSYPPKRRLLHLITTTDWIARGFFHHFSSLSGDKN